MFVEIEKIVVDDRIRKEYGNLQELADNISENTLMNPPVVMPNGDGTYTLIAGERRLRAMRDILGYMQTEVNVVTPRDAEQMLLMEISENECRKEFTMTERLDYAAKIKAVESAKAKVRQGTRTDLAQDFVQSERNQAANAVADAIGTNRETLRQAQIISDNRDLLDPADFTDWDEGKLSTNKAFQRIKAAMEQAEQERMRAERELQEAAVVQTNLEMEAESLRQRLAEREKAEEEYRTLKVQRDSAIESFEELATDNESLQHEIAELEAKLEKQADEAFEEGFKAAEEQQRYESVHVKEVVREVVPEEVKRRIESLEYDAQVHADTDQKLRRQLAETRKKLDRAKVLLKEKGYEDNASWDISTLTTATNQYLRMYGGKAWAFDQFYRVDEVTQQEFVKAMTNLAAFSQNIVQIISDRNKLEA